MFQLTHKKVLITGGCSGIGQSIALTFLAQGAQVHIIDLKPSADPMPSDITFHQADITSLEAVKAIAEKLKSLDILVNNAGIPQIGNLEKTSPDDFQNIFDVNVKGAYHCMYAFIPAMIEQKSGVILNMASVAASVGIPDRFGYSMTKGAIKNSRI